MEIASWQLAGAIEAVRGHVPIENLASDALAKRLMEAIPLAPQADGQRHPGQLPVTEASLASALEGFYLDIRPPRETMTIHGQVADADALAASLFATLSRMAALREPEPGDVVDAHICCEHVPDDRELSAMADIVRLMGRPEVEPYAVIRALYPLDGHQLHRVLRWLLARFPAPADLPF